MSAANALPRRVSGSLRDWLLYDSAATRAIEHAALEASAPHALMARAGMSVARLTLAVAPLARRIELACGPGNNGGDGLVAARWLKGLGRDVSVRLMGGGGTAPADASWALQQAIDAGVAIGLASDAASAQPQPDLCVDAMLGLGSSRALGGDMAAWAAAHRAAPVIAVDLPSGLNADTGMPWGDTHAVAVCASHTLSLLTLKPGFFTARGRDHCGLTWFDDLGVASDAAHASASLFGSGAMPLARADASHKGSFGDVVVVGGAAGMSGAAVLAGEAALAAGAGRVYVSALAPSSVVARPELMQRDAWWTQDARQLREATVVCGCGGGSAVADVLPPLLAHVPRLVLDADALNAIARASLLMQLLVQRCGRGMATALTPHPLEAARLLGRSVGEVMADRLEAAQALAARFQCVVALKGSGTIVTAPQALPTINATGNAMLATAGTGDVLAGWLGARLAERSSDEAAAKAQAPELVLASTLRATRIAVWEHGRAADLEWLARSGDAPGAKPAAPLRARDLIERMHAAMLSPPALAPLR